MKLFFDNCLSPAIPEALKLLVPQATISHLREKFPADTKDLLWITDLGNEGGWTVVSTDALWKVPQQVEALHRARLTLFVFRGGFGELPLAKQAFCLLKRWDEFERIVKAANPGDWYDVPALRGGIRKHRHRSFRRIHGRPNAG